MSVHRKKPFSAKQKKKQLLGKREKKRDGHVRSTAQDGKGGSSWSMCPKTNHYCHWDSFSCPNGNNDMKHQHHRNEESNEDDDDDVDKINQQPLSSSDMKKGYDPNRYRLHFMADSRKEIDKRKKMASEPYTMLPEESLEMDIEEIYPADKPLNIPIRPTWDYSLTRQALNDKEERYFKGYVNDILSKYKLDELSYFELNLETWRQLWRVLEMSDVVLIICDIRFPALHFCPALYNCVVKEMKKRVILVLNKIDLAAPSVVVAWKHYLKKHYPEIHIVCFTSFPRDFSVEEEKRGIQSKKKRRRFNAVGTYDLLKTCEAIVEDKVDLLSWRQKIAEDAHVGTFDDDVITEQDNVTEPASSDYEAYQLYKDGVLTIGCIGYPNVGKSSLLNGLVGKKVVSISKTPGHTKHFQTIYLTPTVRLCDCPGLVFPSFVSRPLQILAGIYPIAQVREPYTAVEYMARRIDLPQLLDLRHPEDENAQHEQRRRDLPWSAMDICYAWADKRGFTTAKIARPDAYRAANHLLRLSSESRICLASMPPAFVENKDFWLKHAETEQMTSLQAASYARGHEMVESGSDNEGLPTSEQEDISGEEIENDQGGEEEVTAKPTKGIKTHNPFALLGSESDE